MEKIVLDGFFVLMDFSLSHKIVLIRNTEYIDNKPVNTDIAFSSTFYLQIPSVFRNLTIENGNEDDCIYILNQCEGEFISRVRKEEVFVLTSQEKKYYIGARRLEITINHYDPMETSLGLKR